MSSIQSNVQDDSMKLDDPARQEVEVLDNTPDILIAEKNKNKEQNNKTPSGQQKTESTSKTGSAKSAESKPQKIKKLEA